MADAISESLAALARFFVGEAPRDETLRRVVDLAASAIEPATMVGVTMMVEERPQTAFFNNEELPEIDTAQYTSGEGGPCMRAFTSGETVFIESTASDERWPTFARLAAAHGVRSTMSLCLVAAGERVGAINFYGAEESAFGDDHLDQATLFAAQASSVLLNSQAYWDARDLADGLRDAMASSATIEQAKGILMAQSNVTADEAFTLLRRASQRENRKLRDIATDIVARVAPLTPAD